MTMSPPADRSITPQQLSDSVTTVIREQSEVLCMQISVANDLVAMLDILIARGEPVDPSSLTKLLEDYRHGVSLAEQKSFGSASAQAAWLATESGHCYF